MARRVSSENDAESGQQSKVETGTSVPVDASAEVGKAAGKTATTPRPRVVKTVSAKSSGRTLRISTPRLVLTVAAGVALLGTSLYLFHVAENFLIRDPRFAVQGFSGRGLVNQSSDGSPVQPSLLVSGAKYASLRTIESVFASDMGRSTYLIPLTERMTTLRKVDWIRDASVARVWPDRVVVQISEREPVAFLPLPSADGDSSVAGLIDADGVILPPTKGNFTLPVLVGLSRSDNQQTLKDGVGRMLSVAAALGDDMRNISEVDVSDRDNVVISQEYDGRVLKLKLGDRNFLKRYRSFVRSYPDIREHAPGARILDLRLETRIIAE